MTDIRDILLQKFHNSDYRRAYVESFLNSMISGQIRALREREGMSQDQLAEQIGTTQPGVSRFENPNYCSWRIETLRKVARAFDMALSIKFVSFGDIIGDIDRFDKDRLLRPSFDHDPVFQDRAGDTLGSQEVGADRSQDIAYIEDYRRGQQTQAESTSNTENGVLRGSFHG